MKDKNPFAQPQQLACWQLHCANITPNLIDELHIHEAIIAISQPTLHNPDRLHCYCDSACSEDMLRDYINNVSAICGANIIIENVKTVKQQDWVAQTQADFPQMQVGRFHIIGSHHSAQHGKYCLRMDAGAAFGTGEHATTSGCLQAIDGLLKKQHFHHVLDMGCGTAILGMAVAKAQKAKTVVVDNDDVAVNVARDNIAKNMLSNYVTALCSEGFKDPYIDECAPYDMVVANILAKPVRQMAKDIARIVAKNAAVILSGFYVRDSRYILNYYSYFGMKCEKMIENNGWATLILRAK